MLTRFCQDCGKAAAPAAVFCESCGSRLAAPPEDGTGADVRAPAPNRAPNPATSPATAGAPAVTRSNLVRVGLLATVAAVAILAGGAVILDRVGKPAGSGAGPTTAPVASPTEAAASSATPGPTLATPAPTPGPSTTQPPPPVTPGATAAARPSPSSPVPPPATPIATRNPGASPPLVAAETPLAAVAAYLEVRGVPFAGTCATADPAAAPGSYCSALVDDRAGIQVHWVGAVRSEPDTWLLVADGQFGWAVIESAPVVDPAASPPF